MRFTSYIRHWFSGLLLLIVLNLSLFCVRAQTNVSNGSYIAETSFIGWFTNGPGIYTQHRSLLRYTNPILARLPVIETATNLDAINKPKFRLVQTNGIVISNDTFQGFLPGTLNHLVWTNFIAHTNSRETRIWSLRWHPGSWPTNPPALMWNTNNLMWRMKGLTALSPCWTGEGSSGQIPVTALTRRHGYARGHGMGAEGISTNSNGSRVWFLTTNNTLVEARIVSSIVRAYLTRKADYTIFLFAKDLPDSIQPMCVAEATNVFAKYPSIPYAPHPMFLTEQTGHVSAEVPEWKVNTWKGGDSGSPNMLPMPGELVFYSGRSTSGPDKGMQEDMDELCRRQKLDARKYQLQWFDLSEYPSLKPN
ncbi:MAG: hypothetical protein HOP33_07505 [Verrucomicrobia bacterium]|nr:hypothetical protein [Verrucomicrobiota bacterium]